MSSFQLNIDVIDYGFQIILKNTHWNDLSLLQ